MVVEAWLSRKRSIKRTDLAVDRSRWCQTLHSQLLRGIELAPGGFSTTTLPIIIVSRATRSGHLSLNLSVPALFTMTRTWECRVSLYPHNLLILPCHHNLLDSRLLNTFGLCVYPTTSPVGPLQTRIRSMGLAARALCGLAGMMWESASGSGSLRRKFWRCVSGRMMGRGLQGGWR